ncbi:MAG: ComEA family DNA-binding protein [Thermodesulfobacteriota bacterium]
MIKKTLFTLLILLFLAGTAWAEININTANQETLDSLSGIGPVKAQAIIDYRTDNGEFKNVDELLEVNGIGPNTLEGIKDEVTVGE